MGIRPAAELKLEILKMSLWKVFNASQVVRQVSSAELPAGSFVWGKEGFKWISVNTSSASNTQADQQSPWEQQTVEQQLDAGLREETREQQAGAAVGSF